MAVNSYIPMHSRYKVNQVATIVVGGTIGTETFTISLKHPSGLGAAVAMATYVGTSGSTTATATAIEAAWNANNHPWRRAITLVRDTATLTFTANRSGEAFVMSVNTPGGSATFVLTATTANQGPEDMSCAGNYSLGATLAAGDDFNIIGDANGYVSIKYGLDQSGVNIGDLAITTRSGSIGWLGFPATFANVDEIIVNTGSQTFLDVGTVPKVRVLKTAHAQPFGLCIDGTTITDLYVDPSASVAACFLNGEVMTVTNTYNRGRFHAGLNSTLTNFYNLCDCAYAELLTSNAMTLMEQMSGHTEDLTAGAIATMRMNGGTSNLLGSGTVTTATFFDGDHDARQSRKARTITNSAVYGRAKFRYDSSANLVLTLSNATTYPDGGVKGGGAGGYEGSR